MAHPTLPRPSHCPALPCPALPCPALPCPALPCPVFQLHTSAKAGACAGPTAGQYLLGRRHFWGIPARNHKDLHPSGSHALHVCCSCWSPHGLLRHQKKLKPHSLYHILYNILPSRHVVRLCRLVCPWAQVTGLMMARS